MSWHAFLQLILILVTVAALVTIVTTSIIQELRKK